MAVKQKKVEFLEQMIDRKQEYPDERDRLLIK